MDTATARDPFDLLLNAGSSPDLWILVGGPSLLLVLIIVGYTIAVWIRNRRERDAFAREVEAEAARPGGGLTSGGEDEDRPPAYAIPDNLEAEPLDEPQEEPPEALMRDAEATPRPQLRVVPGGAAPEAPTPAPSAAPAARAPAPAPPDAPAPRVPAPAPAVPAPASDVDEVRRTDRGSWLARLRNGLARTRDGLRTNLESLFTGKTKIDQSMLERLHEVLYRADIGAATADQLVDHVRQTLGKAETADWNAVSAALRDKARAIFEAQVTPPLTRPASGPWVILVVGVNGVGKTTTIGKLAASFLAEDKKVLLGAADTFRAAAIEQLGVWGDRLGVDVIKHKAGADPAAVAYDAVKAAMARNTDVLLVDTAGRLHAKTELMAELGKINRVIGKDLPGAPHETWLVIDATTGQNAVQQVKAFSEVVRLTGLVVTKLDGTAKGGVLLGIFDQFKLPVRYVGVGEKAADLRAFNPNDYVESLF